MDSPERAPVPDFSPRRALVPEFCPGRATVLELSPRWAPVPTLCPKSAPVPVFSPVSSPKCFFGMGFIVQALVAGPSGEAKATKTACHGLQSSQLHHGLLNFLICHGTPNCLFRFGDRPLCLSLGNSWNHIQINCNSAAIILLINSFPVNNKDSCQFDKMALSVSTFWISALREFCFSVELGLMRRLIIAQ